MAGLSEGGNEPPGSLKANLSTALTYQQPAACFKTETPDASRSSSDLCEAVLTPRNSHASVQKNQGFTVYCANPQARRIPKPTPAEYTKVPCVPEVEDDQPKDGVINYTLGPEQISNDLSHEGDDE
ncbi:hypothetical protein ANN_24459 [Periplaneta americana]|uniref:Uncharacterized protein n=1 Tax=Periplaneta americana TaxID=6978 RepID=A0ABQ8S3G0_PERAM|nr:hypothetical protein ANN_24459 [Periplaneta americana]